MGKVKERSDSLLGQIILYIYLRSCKHLEMSMLHRSAKGEDTEGTGIVLSCGLTDNY
jgi:hypothetical protein